MYWLHMPMPFTLNRINLWLLRDGDDWTVVDTGLDLPASRLIWEQIFDGLMAGRRISRVIVTHMHPDHMGLAGWLVQRFGCELWMSRDEFLMGRNLVADTGREAPELAIRFYRAAGYDDEALDTYRRRFGDFGKLVAPLPESFRRLVDGETIEINGQYWQIVTGAGHSPEHVCLYCPTQKLLISGDQVLPRISPNVSVYPTEPHGDPLTEWLNSCHRLRAQLPADLLVLPAHQEPFTGLPTRMTQLIDSHERGLSRLYELLSEPRRAIDCFSALFARDIGSGERMLAIGETLAHLHCLLARRMISQRLDDDGRSWYLQRH